MIRKVRVLIVDARPVVRLGLTAAFASSGRLETVGEAVEGDQALELHYRLKPDVVTLGHLSTAAGGLEVLMAIRSEFAAAKILMFSGSEREEDIYRAGEAGAKGCVSQAAGAEELVGAIMTVHQGGEYFSIDVAKKLARRRLRTGLSGREFQVLREVVAGRSNKEIVARLRLSEATVKLHVSNMLTKLGVTDRTQAAIAAVQRGIIHLDG